MRDVSGYIVDRFELGALGTGVHGFYERLGWRTWTGPSTVRMPDGDRPTPDDDGYLMVLATPSTPPIACGVPDQLRVADRRRLVGATNGCEPFSTDGRILWRC